MREIKFRGLRIDGKGWVYGDLFDHDNIVVHKQDYDGGLKTHKYINVIPETVGQFIGLKDRNGKDIYEGDILDVDGTPWLVEPIGTEERDGGKFGLCASPYGSGEAYFIDKSILDGKVIGNIHEKGETK